MGHLPKRGGAFFVDVCEIICIPMHARILKSTFNSIIFLLIFTLGLPSVIRAYVPFSAASAISVIEDTPIGSIVSFENNVYRLSNKAYDAKIVGVVVEQADIIVEEVNAQQGSTLMLDRGEARILVNGETGNISPGDLLTSSSIQGQAMKADKDGIVVAIALEEFLPENPSDTSLIRALVDIRFTTVGDTFSADSIGLSDQGMVSSLQRTVSEIIGLGSRGLAGTSPIFRYTLATIIVAIAFVSGFMLFGRIALRGVEALGRNPLARKTIIVGIVVNSVFTVLLVSFAIILAYVIITA